MPLKNYGVLKGRPIDRRLGSGSSPHYQVKLVDEELEWRIAINVQSADGSEVEYALISHFNHPITDFLEGLEHGFTALPPSGAQGLDYIRGNLADHLEFVPLPITAQGPDNDLNEKLDHYIQRTMADESAALYAFGETWHEPKRDKIFGFKPGQGIHDIHMNQGNSGKWQKDNGPWQDGGLIIHFPAPVSQWVAIFLKFQTQAWHTDDLMGDPMEIPVSGPPSDAMIPARRGLFDLPTTERPEGLVRIIAALVSDKAGQDGGTVTLLNTSNEAINLSGWCLLDRQKNRLPLDGVIQRGETMMLTAASPLQLSDKGGLITLLNAENMKVHGVSYSEKQVKPGWTITFR